MIKIAKERRSQPRKQVTLSVFYSYTGEHEMIFDNGTVFDLSNSGMSFYTYMPIQMGQNIQVLITDIWDSPRSGVVKWCTMKDRNSYKVGICFH